MRAAAYRPLLRERGLRALLGAALVAAVAHTMLPLGLVLFVRERSGSFATAGLVVAAWTLGGVALGPWRGRLVDRRGPSRAVLLLALPALVADAAFVGAGLADAPPAVLVALAAAAGAVTAPVGSAWRNVLAERVGEAERQPAFALMTVVQEIAFLLGPLLVALLTAAMSAGAALVAGVALALAGALSFAATAEARAAGAHPAPADRADRPALLTPGLRTLLATGVFSGITFGAIDVAVPALARAEGAPAAAGLLLAALSLGIIAGGVAAGLVPAPRSAGRLYPLLCVVAAAGMVPLLATTDLWLFAALAVVAGIGEAPLTTAMFAVIDEVTPPARRAEAFSTVGAVGGTGIAIGAALAGVLVTEGSARSGLALAVGAAALGAAVALARRRSLVSA